MKALSAEEKAKKFKSSKWKIVGITDERDTCEVCGKTPLKKVVVLDDGEVTKFVGTECASIMTSSRAERVLKKAVQVQSEIDHEKQDKEWSSILKAQHYGFLKNNVWRVDPDSEKVKFGFQRVVQQSGLPPKTVVQHLVGRWPEKKAILTPLGEARQRVFSKTQRMILREAASSITAAKVKAALSKETFRLDSHDQSRLKRRADVAPGADIREYAKTKLVKKTGQIEPTAERTYEVVAYGGLKPGGGGKWDQSPILNFKDAVAWAAKHADEASAKYQADGADVCLLENSTPSPS